jgi:hypothetical protein
LGYTADNGYHLTTSKKTGQMSSNFGEIVKKPGFQIRIHFFRIRIWIQRLRLETNPDPAPDPDPIRIQGFNDQKLKKNDSWKKN